MKLKEAYLLQPARVPGNGGDVVTWLSDSKFELSLESGVVKVVPRGAHSDKWFLVPITNVASMVPSEPLPNGKLK